MMIPWHCTKCQSRHIGYAPTYTQAYDELNRHLWNRHGIDYDSAQNSKTSAYMDDDARQSSNPFIHIYNVVPDSATTPERVNHERHYRRNYLRSLARIFHRHTPQHAKRIP